MGPHRFYRSYMWVLYGFYRVLRDFYSQGFLSGVLEKRFFVCVCVCVFLFFVRFFGFL